MKTIFVDDDCLLLLQYQYECSSIPGVELMGTFECASDALAYARQNPVELAFLDVELPDMSGLELSAALREIVPHMVIIFASGHDKYITQALNLDADYYILKPPSRSVIVSALNRAKLLVKRMEPRVFIKTFGNFDVFVDGKPIKFSSSRAKELLAYLVDRNGNVVSSAEGFSVLWEDKDYSESSASGYRKVLARLHATLKQEGIEDILYSFPHGRALNKSKVQCDYYSLLEGSTDFLRAWNGEYMSNYSWAEYTLASLSSRFSLEKNV